MREIRIERDYPHPPERVWRALTTPELLARWLMPNDFLPTVGHTFTFRTDPGPGFDGIIHSEVLELDAPSRLVLAWRASGQDTRVVFDLTELDGATRLVLVHEGFRGLGGFAIRALLGRGWRRLLGQALSELLDSSPPPTPSEAP